MMFNSKDLENNAVSVSDHEMAVLFVLSRNYTQRVIRYERNGERTGLCLGRQRNCVVIPVTANDETMESPENMEAMTLWRLTQSS